MFGHGEVAGSTSFGPREDVSARREFRGYGRVDSFDPRRWKAVGALAAGMLVAACGIVESADGFGVRVDSIELPRSASGTEEIVVRFHGMVGSDGCSRVAEVMTARAPHLLVVSFRGERRSGGDCPQMPAILQHEERVSPPYDLPFTVRVQQPDGSIFERTVVAD